MGKNKGFKAESKGITMWLTWVYEWDILEAEWKIVENYVNNSSFLWKSPVVETFQRKRDPALYIGFTKEET